ncbi:MAG: hypothetical protein SH808_03885 [Saprospiraceae bacterium]|nr:hypothetical protein [Saprospiraceae bacterium]
MLYRQTIDNITLAVLKGIMASKLLDNFVLVGGTALAFQIVFLMIVLAGQW